MCHTDADDFKTCHGSTPPLRLLKPLPNEGGGDADVPIFQSVSGTLLILIAPVNSVLMYSSDQSPGEYKNTPSRPDQIWKQRP